MRQYLPGSIRLGPLQVGQDYKSRPRGGTHEGCGAGTPGLSHCWPSRPALWTQLMRMRKENNQEGGRVVRIRFHRVKAGTHLYVMKTDELGRRMVKWPCECVAIWDRGSTHVEVGLGCHYHIVSVATQ